MSLWPHNDPLGSKVLPWSVGTEARGGGRGGAVTHWGGAEAVGA